MRARSRVEETRYLPTRPAHFGRLHEAGFHVTGRIWVNWVKRQEKVGGEWQEKPRKITEPAGCQNNENEWKPLDELRRGIGTGLIMQRSECLVIDLDGVYDPEADVIDPRYRPFVEACSCVQRSQSRTGLHCFYRAFPDRPAANWVHPDGRRLEMYGRFSAGRFLAMTGCFMRGKARLPDLLDDESDVLGRLLDGWTKGKPSSAPGVAPVTDKSGALDKLKLPPPPELSFGNEELIEIAMELNGHPKGTPFDLMSRRYFDRSSARQGLLVRLAALRFPEDRIAAFAREYLPDHYAERSDPARDLYGEVRRAIAYVNPELPDWCGSVS